MFPAHLTKGARGCALVRYLPVHRAIRADFWGYIVKTRFFSAISAAALLLFLGWAGVSWSQENGNTGQNADSNEHHSLQAVAQTTKAIDYAQGKKSEISFRGTDLMPGITGEAHVDTTRPGTTRINATLDHLRPANQFGLEYLTYVMWAVSPEGVPSNLGELMVKGGKSKIEATTPLQAFALLVTAEPDFAVAQPSDKVVAQNEAGPKAQGWERTVNVSYEAIPASAYAAQVQPLGEPVYGIDEKVPLSLREARNALRIARAAHADEYASPSMQRAQQLLQQADDYFKRKQNDKAIATVAREATQAAEAARVTALKSEQQARIDQENQRAREEAARAQSEAESQARQAQQAEADRAAAEQQAAQAQAAAQQAAAAAQAAQQQVQEQMNSGQQVQAQQQADLQQAQAQAEQAQQAAAAAQQRAQDQERVAREAEQKLQQEQAANQQSQQQLQETQQQAQQAQQQLQETQQQAQQAREQLAKTQAEAQQQQETLQQTQQEAQLKQQELEKTRQELQQTQQDKEQVRQRLLGQLNQVMQTKDSAQGLIVNMPDVLFKLNSATLRPDARERLAKVAGILLAYPDIHVEVNGYTDNTGSPSYNEQLSQQRADAVRNFLVQQGVPQASIQAQGFGQDNPVAANNTPEGRSQNRRVDLVVSGEAIGQASMPNGMPR